MKKDFFKKNLSLILTGLILILTMASCSDAGNDEPEQDSGDSTPTSTDIGSSDDTSEDDTGTPENNSTEEPDTEASSSTPSSENTSDTGTTIITEATTDPTQLLTSAEELPPEETTSQTVEINTENGVVQTAEALLGIPFAENGSDPESGFDNSGFIYYVLRENGFINCPRLTGEQAEMGAKIDYNQLKSGDLAFFCTADSGNPDFGGIYIGDGKMIYCPMPGQTVKEADISTAYWQGAFVTGVSLS